MRTIKVISTEVSETLEIEGLVEVYEEMAASEMQKIRSGVLNARNFFERLANLSNEVGVDLEKAGLGRSGDVAVFVSSQTGLYGDIIDKIFVDFMKFVNENPKAERIVFGKLGDNMMKTLASNISYKYFDLVDEEIDEKSLPEVLSTLVGYKQIHLFYGKFNNIVNQETWTSTISGKTLGDVQPQNIDIKQFLYLYEPNVETVSKIFTEQIAGSVFNQLIKESRLAKFASRLMYLDNAIEKCNEKITSLSLEKSKSRKRMVERKQLVSFSGCVGY